MELRQVKYFLVLAEELHFRKAAERLFIVQPALSKQIKLLEEELGTALLKRDKRNVQLTAAGEYFQKETKAIIDQLELIKSHTRLVQEGEKGEIRIGYVGSCIHTFLPDVLTEMHQSHPHIQTYLNEMTSRTQLEAIKNGELDIAFLRNPYPQPQYGSQLVYREPFSIVLPQNHPIGPENFKEMAQLATEEFILPTQADGELYYRLQLSICEDSGFSPHIAHETVHGHTVLNLVDHGLGITFLPSSFKNVSNAAVKFIPLPDIPQKAEITALWNKENPNPSLQKLLRFIPSIR
ncbi:LysR substrate-binding domain-containing protein [Echinicola vietnamensis]|uniref:Transcriptional regulator n=1 Tax=Echinicola vietnamensis (strain DSM 17526 / LMG 23754 / KMM 6221) TaxID=926556 RepID=L0FRG5_ECHVK|nr:LysR substrate-binding domain-containing protein [Echinicola vietnamensis]AGA76499.1 transcriptional regulator [Echinicola vietnamensis DSM 17526]